MQNAANVRCFVGVDWGTEEHAVCAIGPDGAIRGSRTVRHEATALSELADWLVSLGDGEASAVGVAIEIPHGALVDTLLERGLQVAACNPKQLDRFRDRFTVAGAKDDARDARVLADALRTDGRAFRLLEPDAPEVIELREWSRMTAEVQAERQRLANRYREQLRRYYPQALQLSHDVAKEWFLALLEAVPTPAAAETIAEKDVAQLLKTHRMRRHSAAAVLEILRQPAVHVAPGTVTAVRAHLAQLTERLRLANRQHRDCERQLDRCCAAIAEADASKREGQADEPSDVEILRSVPGIGRIILACLLAEAARLLARRDYHALRALGGVAPVTQASGKRSRARARVSMRRACNHRLRDALYHWARTATQRDPHWKARYAALRRRGHSHGRACRGIADRLLNVICSMLRHRTSYDAERLAA